MGMCARETALQHQPLLGMQPACLRPASSTLAPGGQAQVCGPLEAHNPSREEQNGFQLKTENVPRNGQHHQGLSPQSTHFVTLSLLLVQKGCEGPGKGSVLSVEGHTSMPPNTPWPSLEGRPHGRVPGYRHHLQTLGQVCTQLTRTHKKEKIQTFNVEKIWSAKNRTEPA